MFAVRKIWVAFVTVLMMAYAASSHAAPPNAIASDAVPMPASLKIVAFGSSSTEGIGASRQAASYPAQLKILLGQAMPGGTSIEVVNRGIGGEDADDMMKRLDNDVIARHPDLVIWQTGSNDPIRHVPLDRFERETRAGIRAMRNAGIKVMLMEPQWCPRLAQIDSANAYRDVVRNVGAEMGVFVIRRYDLMQDWLQSGLITKTEMISDDNLHMRDKGYALLARWVASAIVQMDIVAKANAGDRRPLQVNRAKF